MLNVIRAEYSARPEADHELWSRRTPAGTGASLRVMSWEHHLPDGVSDVQKTPDGFTGGVSIPPDEDGYIGRRCAG